MRRQLLSLLPILLVELMGNRAHAQEQYDQNFDEEAQQSLTAPGSTAEDAAAGPDAAIDYETFHAALSPYGQWIYTADYGWVWTPNGVTQDWQPYQDGEWQWTAYGWTWVGAEPWAWAPYHYGRWVYLGWGWAWVPDYVWGPAWVSWRWGPDYVGWTALWPGWGFGVAWGYGWPIYYNQWCFVGYGGFYATPINHATVYPASTVQNTIWNNTHSVDAVAVDGVTHVGPTIGQVETASGRTVTPVAIHPITSVGQASALHGMHGGMLNVVTPPFRSAPQPFTQPDGQLARVIPANHPIGVQPVITTQARVETLAPATHGGGVTPYHGSLPGNPATQQFGPNGPAGQRVAQAPASGVHGPTSTYQPPHSYSGNAYRPPGAGGYHPGSVPPNPHSSGNAHPVPQGAYHGGSTAPGAHHAPQAYGGSGYHPAYAGAHYGYHSSYGSGYHASYSPGGYHASGGYHAASGAHVGGVGGGHAGGGGGGGHH